MLLVLPSVAMATETPTAIALDAEAHAAIAIGSGAPADGELAAIDLTGVIKAVVGQRDAVLATDVLL